MFELDRLVFIKCYMEYLSQGIDPTSLMKFSNDTILNNRELQMCFKDVVAILHDYLNAGGTIHKRATNSKYKFQISEYLKDQLVYLDESIAISKFAFIINSNINTTYMKKLKATQITYWLKMNGYLKEVNLDNDRIYKIVTEKGQSIGISSIEKVNSIGNKYYVNLYNSDAQRFIVEHLREIVNE